MREEIEAILAPYENTMKVGIEVFSLTRNKVLFAKNEEELFVPASCTKLFTTVASLRLLGHDFRFTTEFLSDAKPAPLLDGNLYIRGSGDPSFTQKDLEGMANELCLLGIKKIKGDIILDAEAFDHIYKAPGVISHDDDEEALWGAKVSGLTINNNCEEVWIHPGMLDTPPLVDLPTSIPASAFSNLAKTSGKTGEIKIFKKGIYELVGEIGQEERPIQYFLPVEDPIEFFSKKVLELLKSKGVEFHGKVLQERTRENVYILAQHFSEKLPELLPRILKESDNLYADALFKKMGFKKEMLGSWESGKRAGGEFFQKHMMDRYEFFDGSGLSHHNQVSPKQITRLLRDIYYDKRLCEDFFRALPIGGIDGTLKDRMKESKGSSIRAKTGSLKGVSSLSGYIMTNAGENLVFSILAKGEIESVEQFKNDVEDRIALFLEKKAKELPIFM